MQALKVLDKRSHDCQTTWIRRSGPNILQPQPLEKPNPSYVRPTVHSLLHNSMSLCWCDVIGVIYVVIVNKN
jgi:hypothetical protein